MPHNIYCCADSGFVALSGSIQATAKRIFETIGRPEMIADPRFGINIDRVRNLNAFLAWTSALAQACSTRAYPR